MSFYSQKHIWSLYNTGGAVVVNTIYLVNHTTATIVLDIVEGWNSLYNVRIAQNKYILGKIVKNIRDGKSC